MKMMYNGTQIKSLNVKHYEMDSNFATVEPSDMQSGKTAVAKGKKITGTGKSFEFAQYGNIETNSPLYVPNTINVIEIASLNYPIKSSIPFSDMGNIDFSVSQVIGHIDINGSNSEISVKVENNLFTVTCSETIKLQIFYGRDRYL